MYLHISRIAQQSVVTQLVWSIVEDKIMDDKNSSKNADTAYLKKKIKKIY